MKLYLLTFAINNIKGNLKIYIGAATYAHLVCAYITCSNPLKVIYFIDGLC